jgi:hypothetical protein
MPRRPRHKQLDGQQANILRTHLKAAKALPAPDIDPWLRKDAPPEVARWLNKFLEAGIVSPVDESFIDGTYLNRYRVDERCHRYAEELDAAETPCGHSGARCLVAGERYTCIRDYCDETFDRETALAEVSR